MISGITCRPFFRYVREIAVSRKHDGFVTFFRHPDETRIGEAHRCIAIASDKSQRFHQLVLQRVANNDNPALQQAAKRLFPVRSPFQQKQAFGNDRLAGDKRRRRRLEMGASPAMVLIPAPQCRDQRSRVNEHVFFP